MNNNKKLLQGCPNCGYKFKPKDFVANLAICKQCNTSFSKFIVKPHPIYTYRKWIVGLTLILATANFGYLIYKQQDIVFKKDSTSTHFIKRYWNELKEEKLLSILQGCIKKNDLKCQVMAYKRLSEIAPNDAFYKKSFEARKLKWEKSKNTPFYRLGPDNL